MLDVHDTGSEWRVMRVAGNLECFDAGGYVMVSRDEYYQEIWRLEYPDMMALPERTRVNVACLRMCRNGERIKGIGQKVTDNTYWLDESPELLEEYGDVV